MASLPTSRIGWWWRSGKMTRLDVIRSSRTILTTVLRVCVLGSRRAFRAAAAARPLWVCTAPRSCPPPAGSGSACARSWCDDAPSVCTASPPLSGGSRTNWGTRWTPGAPGGSCSCRCGSPARRSGSPRLCTPSQRPWPGKLTGNKFGSIKH